MLSQLSSLARSGVIALTALASLTPAASGAPLGPVLDQPVAAGTVNNVIPVEMGEGRDRGNPAYMWRHGRRGGNWGGGNWGGGRNWDRGHAYNDNWRGRYGGRYWRHGGYGNNWGGFALGLGLGVPLGYYAGRSYDAYDPYYAPYRPRYYQPRVYRGGGSAHVEWCYSRYRSYRAWDNSWQPNYGRRRLCISPYS